MPSPTPSGLLPPNTRSGFIRVGREGGWVGNPMLLRLARLFRLFRFVRLVRMIAMHFFMEERIKTRLYTIGRKVSRHLA